MELFLFVLAFICYLFLGAYLSTKKEGDSYIKILSGIAMIILVWVGGAEGPFGPKLVLTSLALSAIWKGYIPLKKRKQETL